MACNPPSLLSAWIRRFKAADESVKPFFRRLISVMVTTFSGLATKTALPGAVSASGPMDAGAAVSGPGGDSRGRTMKKLLIVFAFLAVLAMVGALNCHVVLLDEEIKILRKVDLTFDDTIVDARGVNKIKLFSRPRLIRAGIVDLIENDSVTIRK
jgi:hypothetical protein